MITSRDLEELGIPWCFREASDLLARTGQPFVINLDDRSGPGSHWTAARLYDGVLYYADPFGSILNGWPPKELSRYPSVVNGISFQRPSTQLCGYYAICFVLAMRTMDRHMTQKEYETLLHRSIM